MGKISAYGDIRKEVFEALDVTIEIVDEKVEFLENWFKQRQDSYEIPSKHMLELFLILNKFNIDASQKKLIRYYELRPKVPELFKNKNPALPHMQKIADVTYFLPLPYLTPELYSINIFKLKDPNPKNFNAFDFAAYIFNVAELKLLSNRYGTGEVFVFDLENISFAHFFSFGVGIVRKISKVTEEVYSARMKGIHYINCPKFTEAIVSVVKTVFKPKLAKRIHVHSSYETLFDIIPRELFPSDYGGQEKSLEELNEMQKMEFVAHQGRFDFLDRITESMTVKEEEEDDHNRVGVLRNIEID